MEGPVQLFSGTARQLERELDLRTSLPRIVHLSPATDPFPPQAEVQDETAAVVEVLARRGVGSWLVTRGFIRPGIRQRLAAQANRVRITIGLTTMDRSLQRLLEPLAAPSRLRVRQIASLRRAGLPVQVSLEPLIPGVTDTRANLAPMLEALAAVGIRHITAGYLFLRSDIEENLVGTLAPLGLDEMVRAAYADGPYLRNGNIRPARYLPRTRRQRGYAALMALAAGYGITVSVSATTNPDFPARPAGRAR
jgi:DNA repair photolyase